MVLVVVSLEQNTDTVSSSLNQPLFDRYGSGRLAHFTLVKHCNNMRHSIEWIPAGDKSSGQPYTVCAIACSYEPDCIAYSAGLQCYHGIRGSVPAMDCDATPATPAECGPTLASNNTCAYVYIPPAPTPAASAAAVPAENVTDVDAGSPPTTHAYGTTSDANGFQRNFTFGRNDYDDSSWPIATLPHDPLINQTFNISAGVGAAFLPRRVIWYRKHFSLPESFKGKHIFIYFEGAFQFSEIYLNGNHIQVRAVAYHHIGAAPSCLHVYYNKAHSQLACRIHFPHPPPPFFFLPFFFFRTTLPATPRLLSGWTTLARCNTVQVRRTCSLLDVTLPTDLAIGMKAGGSTDH